MKKINAKYQIVNIREEKTVVSKSEIDRHSEGLIFLPYVTVTSFEPNPERKVFMDWYDDEHKYCPKCGSEQYCQTLVGYILDMDNKEAYKDKNMCTCSDCGDNHIVHDRVKISNAEKN
jgi:hypothetical protein